MKNVDVDAACKYIVAQMAAGLAQNLYYHGLHHTVNDVVPAVERLAAEEGIDGEDLLLLRTAAYYHDVGYMYQYNLNEPIAVQVAREALPEFGYRPNQIDRIAEIIMATQLPQQPTDLLQQIMCDGDLDTLGREDFFVASHNLRLELAQYGQPTTIRQWYERQLEFLYSHRYFTASAQSLRAAAKLRNIREIENLIITGC